MNIIQESFYHEIGTDVLTQKEHSHTDTYEIIQILEGTGELIIRDKAYHFERGAVFLIDAENFHYSVPQAPDSYIRNKMIIKKSALLKAADTFGFSDTIISMFDSKNNNSVYLDTKTSLTVDNLCQKIHSTNRPLEATIEFLKLVDILWQNIKSPVSQDKVLNHIFETINKYIGNDFSLNVLSKETNMDKYYLCHYFKSKTNMTIFEYLKKQRIEYAKKLLVEKKLPISQISDICGYNSLAYFSKCFKKSTGMTPSEFTKHLHE